jgi:hypothetical protein
MAAPCRPQRLPFGIVGGKLAPLKAAGASAASPAARLLSGELPAGDHSVALPMDSPVYDWRELERWRIPESALPPDSTVVYREPQPLADASNHGAGCAWSDACCSGSSDRSQTVV